MNITGARKVTSSSRPAMIRAGEMHLRTLPRKFFLKFYMSNSAFLSENILYRCTHYAGSGGAAKDRDWSEVVKSLVDSALSPPPPQKKIIFFNF